MYKLSIEVSTLAELSELTRKLNSDAATTVELTSTTTSQEVNGFANVFQTPAAAPTPAIPTQEELLAGVQGMFAAAAGLTQAQQSEVIQNVYSSLGWAVDKKLSECTAEELMGAIPKFKENLAAKGVMV